MTCSGSHRLSFDLRQADPEALALTISPYGLIHPKPRTKAIEVMSSTFSSFLRAVARAEATDWSKLSFPTLVTTTVSGVCRSSAAREPLSPTGSRRPLLCSSQLISSFLSCTKNFRTFPYTFPEGWQARPTCCSVPNELPFFSGSFSHCIADVTVLFSVPSPRLSSSWVLGSPLFYRHKTLKPLNLVSNYSYYLNLIHFRPPI